MNELKHGLDLRGSKEIQVSDYVTRDAQSIASNKTKKENAQITTLYTRDGEINTYLYVTDKAPALTKTPLINYSKEIVHKLIDFLSTGKIDNVDQIRDISKEFNVVLPKNKLDNPINIDKIVYFYGYGKVLHGACLKFDATAEYKIGKYFFRITFEVNRGSRHHYKKAGSFLSGSYADSEEKNYFHHTLSIWDNTNWKSIDGPIDFNVPDDRGLTITYEKIINQLQKSPNKPFVEISPVPVVEQNSNNYIFKRGSAPKETSEPVTIQIGNSDFYEMLFVTIYNLYRHRLTHLYTT